MILPALLFSATQKAEIKADIPYTANASDRQKLDLYLPAERPFKTILFAYGGGWHSGSRKNMALLGKRFQSSGYACAMIGYRLNPPDKWPAQIDDAADAAAWTLKHIAEYGGDPKQVWLAGHSSGAHLVVLLASDPSWLSKRQAKANDFRGVIGFSTPLDLVPRGKNVFADALMAGQGADAFGRNAAVMREASPIEHVPGKDAPLMLLLAADGDMPGLADDAKRFTDLASKKGAHVKYQIVKDRTHMSILLNFLNDGDPAYKAFTAFVGGPFR